MAIESTRARRDASLQGLAALRATVTSRPGILPYLAFAACVAIWGSTWLVIKVGYADVGPFTAASLRFLLAGILLVPAAAVFKLGWPKNGTEWGVVAFVGLLQFAFDYGLIYWGEQFIPSGLTAVLFATLPLFTVLTAHAFLPGERATTRKVAGVLLGFVGVALLFRESLSSALQAPLVPMLAILASAIAVSFTTVSVKRYGGALHPLTLTGLAAGIGGAALVPVALLAGEPAELPTSFAAWWPIVYLAVLGSGVTFALYYWLLRRWSATNASFISVFTPVVALGLGAVLLDEPLTAWIAVGTACIVGGVALANIHRPLPRTGLPHTGGIAK